MSIFYWGIYLGFSGAFMVSQLFTVNQIFGLDWRAAYWSTGCISLVVGPCMYFCFRHQGFSQDEKPSSKISDRLSSFIREIRRPAVFTMIVAGCVRHTAGYSWSYNHLLYYEETLSVEWQSRTRIYLMLCPVIGGASGSLIGGSLTDWISRFKGLSGIEGSLLILVISSLVAAPLYYLCLVVAPPTCFWILFGALLFSEMWFAVFVVAIAKTFSREGSGQAIGYTLFIMQEMKA